MDIQTFDIISKNIEKAFDSSKKSEDMVIYSCGSEINHCFVDKHHKIIFFRKNNDYYQHYFPLDKYLNKNKDCLILDLFKFIEENSNQMFRNIFIRNFLHVCKEDSYLRIKEFPKILVNLNSDTSVSPQNIEVEMVNIYEDVLKILDKKALAEKLIK